jgi:glycosyltransferase involved in cell wall biosynthesis
MRVAIFSWEAWDGIPVTGVATHVSQLARALVRRGHEVHLFTRRTAEQPVEETADGVLLHRPDFELQPDVIAEIQSLCRAFVACLGEVEAAAGPMEILHAHDWTCCNAGVWAAAERDAGLVLTLHSVEAERVGSRELQGDQRRVADHEANGCRHADRVIAVSHGLRRSVMELYGVEEWRSEVVYNGVDVRRYEGFVDPGAVKGRYGIGPLHPLALYAGPLEHRFGPDLLLAAAPAIREAHPEARFLFLGEGPQRAELERRVAELGLAEAVRLVGAVPAAERREIVCACDLLCAPGRSNPFSTEVLEAWAAGKPVVATQHGGGAEYVWHDVNGVHVHQSPDSVAWGVCRVWSDFEWARWLGQNGRAAAETAFTWAGAARQTEEIYRRAHQDRKGAFSV